MVKFLISILILFTLQGVKAQQVIYYPPITGSITTSAEVMASNPLRRYVLIQNMGSVAIIAKFGSSITGSNEGVQIPAGGAYEPILAPTQALFLKSTSAAANYIVIQGN